LSLEDELHRIDHEIRKLKIQFDLYFVGANPKPPNDQRDTVEKLIKKYQNVHMKNVGDRFLYNSLVNKFNAYQELWNKSIRAKEEGVRVHPLAIHKAHQGALAELGGTNAQGALTAAQQQTGGAPPGGPGGSGSAVRARAGHQRGHPADGEVASWRMPVVAGDNSHLQKLYQQFIAAKEQVGDAKKPTFDAFAREIARHTAVLKGKADCEAIDFKIYCKDNKVSIKAKPSK